MTPHIQAEVGQIAKTVIMPGDPLRAKMIADKFLDDAKLVTSVRNILGYTGKYNGKDVTVMASGMGMPSMGIYSYELFKFYDVDNIIRIGSAGSYSKDLDIYDMLLVNSSYSDSSFAKVQNGTLESIMYPSNELNEQIKNTANKLDLKLKCGKVYCSDVFYYDGVDALNICKENNALAVEMESFALFHNANILNKKASCILTISDNLISKDKLSSEDRQNSFTNMIKLVLESI